MADAMNNVRALRLAEIVEEFRNLQYYISQIQANPTPEEYYGEGYVVLRECMSIAEAILQAPFNATAATPNGNADMETAQLQHVIIDASARRFQAQRVYLRATAAMRWINSRNAVLQGQQPSRVHTSALRNVDSALQSELSAITDRYVVDIMRSHDQQQGRWTDEDPSVSAIRHWLASNQ